MKEAAVQIAKSSSPQGFVPLPPIENADLIQVLVFAPYDSAPEIADRANSMLAYLKKNGIPAKRLQSAAFIFKEDTSPKDKGLARTVMKGPLPIVFYAGRGKANPTFDEVLREYRWKKKKY